VTSATTSTREAAIDEVAGSLVPRASLVTRLLLRHTLHSVSRSEASLLAALEAGPQRITTLAGREGLAQPTTTLMVKRLEERGWVTRERDATDGRVVLVSLTEAGQEALEAVRAEYRRAFRDHMLAMPDDQIANLLTATRALQTLIEALQQGDPR
jgi:DNA-binding MarR family transcriptional regulator